LFQQKYGVDILNMFEGKINLFSRLGLLTVDESANRISITPKGRLCVEEIACQFAIPNLADNIPAIASLAERKKLDKHNFAPLYGLIDRPKDI
jgi:hypothetical protein